MKISSDKTCQQDCISKLHYLMHNLIFSSLQKIMDSPILSLKISFDKTCQQDCISKLRKLRVKTVNNVTKGTLIINSLASKFDEFKLVVSGIFGILIITETKLDNTFPTFQFYIEGCQRHISCLEIAIVKILTKHNLLEDIEGIFLEINFPKSKWLLCEIYHSTSQNNHYFYDNIDKP